MCIQQARSAVGSETDLNEIMASTTHAQLAGDISLECLKVSKVWQIDPELARQSMAGKMSQH
jgi:hypothetical protein